MTFQICYDEGLPTVAEKRHRHKNDDLTFSSQYRVPGWKSLAVAIIEQSIMDYFTLVRRKAMRFGKLTGHIGEKRREKRNKFGEHYMTHSVAGYTANDMRELLAFLDGGAKRLAELANIDINLDDMMRRILRYEASGNYRLSESRKARRKNTINTEE